MEMDVFSQCDVLMQKVTPKLFDKCCLYMGIQGTLLKAVVDLFFRTYENLLFWFEFPNVPLGLSQAALP